MTPFLTVVMPIYNAEHYVCEAVQSILDQTWKDFELILLDDGSTDNTLLILRQFERRDHRVLVVTRKNRGLVATLNEGICLARGKWIARMDADDISFPDRFARQLLWLSQTGADICGTWVKCFGTPGGQILRYPITDSAIKTALFFGCAFAHPTVMMRTELARRVQYRHEWEKSEDYDLWQRAVTENWRMTNLPIVLLMYRQHNYQISRSSLTLQHELTQQIRYRHWSMMHLRMGLEEVCIVELLKLRLKNPPAVDLNLVNLALVAVSTLYAGQESKMVLLDHAARLYARAAGGSQHVIRYWRNLHSSLRVKLDLRIFLKLVLLRVFRLRPDSRIFDRLKALSLSCNE